MTFLLNISQKMFDRFLWNSSIFVFCSTDHRQYANRQTLLDIDLGSECSSHEIKFNYIPPRDSVKTILKNCNGHYMRLHCNIQLLGWIAKWQVGICCRYLIVFLNTLVITAFWVNGKGHTSGNTNTQPFASRCSSFCKHSEQSNPRAPTYIISLKMFIQWYAIGPNDNISDI